MGVSHFSYVLSWLITYCIMSFVSMLCVSFLLSNKFSNSSLLIITIPMLLYGFANVSMTYAISTLFKKYI